MVIRKILFPTKFRELSFNSLEPLLALKDAGLKEIILCHIISRDDVGFVPFGGYMKEEEVKLEEKARIRFKDWQKSIEERGIETKVVIKVGEPVPRILHVAEDEGVDLIIVGRKKRRSIEHPFAGSGTLEIITRSKIPAMVSKYMVCFKVGGDEVCERVNDRIFDNPMLVTDWSDPCKRALDLMASLGNVIKKALIFHDMDMKDMKKFDINDARAIEVCSCRKLNEFCSVLNNEGIEAEAHLGAGDLLEEIIRISRKRNATMIIIGTSGRSRFNEFLHGSISHQVAKESELPTLLVP